MSGGPVFEVRFVNGVFERNLVGVVKEGTIISGHRQMLVARSDAINPSGMINRSLLDVN